MEQNIKNLKEIQAYIKKKTTERGFDKETPQDLVLLLTEELGELAKAVRKQVGIKTDSGSKIHTVEEEMADVFVYLLCLANRLGIDLNESLWKKEAENNKRTWK